MHTTTRSALATAFAALLATTSLAQEAVDLDKVDSTPAAAPARRPTMQMGDVSINLFFDASLEYIRPLDSKTKGSLAFDQQHNSLLARASTPDGIEAFADVIHPSNVFEATVPFRFLNEAAKGVPGLDKGSIRFGRILVPFGDFPAHAIYGGSVENSKLVKEQFWSDYGASVKLPFGDKVEAEAYVLNGLQAFGDSSIRIGSSYEDNLSKAAGARLKLYPTTTTFLTVSYLHDALTTPNLGSRGDSAFGIDVNLAGLDVGIRTGQVNWKAGGMVGRVRSEGFRDYSMSSWYAESRWRVSERWSLRLRGGQADPDSRVRDEYDQTDVNLGVIWQKGPLDVSLTWFHNLDTHHPSLKTDAANQERIRLETFVSL